MRAVVIREHGGLDRVRVETLPDPDPGDGEVAIDVRAAALNHLDIWVRRGRPGLSLPMPHVLGSDAAGVVRAVGPGVEGVAPGDEVVLNPGLPCRSCESCRRGEQSECPRFGIVGLSRPGTFAERIAVPAANVFPKPRHLTWEQAAALPLAHLTAFRMLFTRARVRPGETILIHGIGGGVALAALQLARLAGAEVIATSSSDEKLRRAVELGARHTINHASVPDVAARARELTGGRGVDLAFDTAGAATFPIDLAAVRRGGKVVMCGVTTGAAAEANLQAIYWNQLTILGSTMGSDEDFRRLLAAVSATRLAPAVDAVEPLERGREAIGRMEAGQQFGKIVLVP